MIHAILHFNLPASEKEVLRIFDDCQHRSPAPPSRPPPPPCASSYTTYVYTSPIILATLRAELTSNIDLSHASADSDSHLTTLLMHMDAGLYPEPERFAPERWMGLDARKKAEKT